MVAQGLNGVAGLGVRGNMSLRCVTGAYQLEYVSRGHEDRSTEKAKGKNWEC